MNSPRVLYDLRTIFLVLTLLVVIVVIKFDFSKSDSPTNELLTKAEENSSNQNKSINPLIDTFHSMVDNTTKLAQYTAAELSFENENYTESYAHLISKIDNLIASEKWKLGYLYLHGYGVKQNYKLAYKWLKEGAEEGNPRAIGLLGYLYQTGSGVKLDCTIAKEYYEKASGLGEPIAMNNLGYLYQKGLGVTQNIKTAVKWYKKSSEQNCALAQNNLGWLYIKGSGVEQSKEKGIALLESAANNGELRAMFNLKNIYSKGISIPQNTAIANMWSAKADSLKRKLDSQVVQQ